MSKECFLDGRVALHKGDCLEVLAALPENSVDSIVCDPPYHLHSIVKRFAKTGRTESTRTKSGPHQRTATGFMGKQWDGGDVAFQVETWAACQRILKPGGYIVAFSSTRTYHRMACAIEDAGFITQPMGIWAFASGFPKAHNAARAIDRELGAGTVEAAAWQGFAYGGQALKPALEPIYFGQKPFSERNGAANILRWGCGALNIDGCRIDGSDNRTFAVRSAGDRPRDQYRTSTTSQSIPTDVGRWPSNLFHDGSDCVVAMFPDSDGQKATISTSAPSEKTSTVYGKMRREGEASAERRYADSGSTNFAALPGMRRTDTGSAARFFWASKAGNDDRLGSRHPTVKPLDLMQELVRLVTPPGGTCLDPFAGTGTTGEAAWREGMRAILIEREPEYQADIARRMDLATNPTKRSAVAATKNNLKDGTDDLPLFASA